MNPFGTPLHDERLSAKNEVACDGPDVPGLFQAGFVAIVGLAYGTPCITSCQGGTKWLFFPLRQTELGLSVVYDSRR
jgi:hypothetical protein